MRPWGCDGALFAAAGTATLARRAALAAGPTLALFVRGVDHF